MTAPSAPSGQVTSRSMIGSRTTGSASSSASRKARAPRDLERELARVVGRPSVVRNATSGRPAGRDRDAVLAGEPLDRDVEVASTARALAQPAGAGLSTVAATRSSYSL